VSRYYKLLCEGGVSPYAKAQWPLPSKNEDGTWTPGEWMPALPGEVVRCRNGYHFCTVDNLPAFLNAELYELEVDEGADVVTWDDKCATTACCRLVRRIEAWNERSARHFACDCAERVLPLFERERPDDERPRRAIAVARRFADGEATRGELAAARCAVWSTAECVAWKNAERAAWSTAGDAAARAAWDAAGYAAECAAWDTTEGYAAAAAEWSAAYAAEREWQAQRLFALLGLED